MWLCVIHDTITYRHGASCPLHVSTPIHGKIYVLYYLAPTEGEDKDYIITISGSLNSRNETVYTITLHSNEMRERQNDANNDWHEPSVKRR